MVIPVQVTNYISCTSYSWKTKNNSKFVANFSIFCYKATQMSEMHLGSTQYEKWQLRFNFQFSSSSVYILVVRNTKAWPTCFLLWLGGHMKNGWTISTQTKNAANSHSLLAWPSVTRGKRACWTHLI